MPGGQGLLWKRLFSSGATEFEGKLPLPLGKKFVFPHESDLSILQNKLQTKSPGGLLFF